MTRSERQRQTAGTVRTHCPYCAFQCGLLVTPIAGGSVAIAGDTEFPVNAGALCVKGYTAGETLTHAERLTAPLARNAEGVLAPVGWDEAFARIAAGFRLAQRKYGREAVGVFGGGSLTNEKVYLLGKFARVVLRTPNIDYNGRFCMSSAAAAGLRAFGLDRGLPFPVSDIAGADAILLVGANVTETMPPIMQYFDAQRRAGGQLIVVDPRRTSTAEQATMHLRLVPGTDAILAHGLLHVLIHERLIDEAYIRERTEGFEAVRAHAASYWPERVERLTGVPQRDIVAAARTLGLAGNALVLTARGAEQQSQGVDNVLSFINLALAMGRVGRPYNGYGCLTGQGNGQGGREHGQKADQLPGYRRIDDAAGARGDGALVGHRRRRICRARAVRPTSCSIRSGGIAAYAGLLVMGSNPVVSAPNATHIEERLRLARLACRLRLLPLRNGAAGRRRPAVRAVGRGGRDDDEPRGPRAAPAAGRCAPPEGVRTDLEILSGLAARAGLAAGLSGVAARRVRTSCGRPRRRAGRLFGHHAGAHRSRAGRVLAVRPRRHRRDAAAVRRSFLTPNGRARFHASTPTGPPSGRTPSTRSISRPAASWRSTSRARRRAACDGCARPRGVAARRDASAGREASRPRQRRRDHDRDPPRPRLVPAEDDAAHPRRHDLRAVPLARRAVGEPPDQPRARSDQPDA